MVRGRRLLILLLISLTGCLGDFQSMSLASNLGSDTTSPTVTVTSPDPAEVYQGALTLAGGCESGLPVVIAGAGLAAPVSTSCAAGTFSQALTFVTGNGAKAITVTQTDAAGNVGSVSRTFTSGTLLTTTDSFLNTGAATTLTYHAPAANSVALINSTAAPSTPLWIMLPDPWGLSQGSGTITMTYSGTGAFTAAMNLTGLNYSPVNAYPFIGLGGDAYGYHNGNQPPQFPIKLNAMAYMMFDVEYAVTGTYGNLVDALFDQWLIPNASYSAGGGGALEVEILPFCIVSGRAGTFQKTFTVPVELNGTATTMTFDEYVTGTGAGHDVLFYPNGGNGLASAHLRFDALLFLNEAAATAGLDQNWMNAGFNFGSEFGMTANQNYTFSVTRAKIEQMVIAP